MVAVNAIGLPEDSPFRNTDRVPLPEDPVVEAQVEEQEKDNSDEDEGAESPESRELSRQIDSHVVVLDDDQPRIGATTSDQTAQPTVTSDPPPNNPSTEPRSPRNKSLDHCYPRSLNLKIFVLCYFTFPTSFFFF